VLTNNGTNTVIAGIGSEDPLLTGLVTQYNNAITKLEPLLSEPSLNPQRKQMESEIAAIRKRLADASDKVLASIQIALQSASSKESEYSNLMRNVPAIGRSINDVKREYEVLQNMYLLLYQKGIENEITLNAANNKSKVVVAPYDSGAPISPVPKNVYLVTILVGLLIPGMTLLIKELFDNKINNEKDIESLTDIPMIGSISKGKLKEDIVVGEHIRTGIAEQFR
jgi:tyrosine-protein kinase Etk/Wzc